MSRTLHAIVRGALVALVLVGLAQAQTTPAQPAAPAAQPAPPTFETKKVEGTDNVYIFRYQNSPGDVRRHQGRRDRHRPDRVRTTAGRDDLY